MKIYVMKEYMGLAFMFAEEVPGTNKIRRAKPLEMEEGPLVYCAEPSLRVPTEEGQHLLDQLWEAGFRPSRGVSSTGEAEAQRDHIKDLREVTGRLLGLVRPR